ncbi:MAG: Hsp20/alpha crystallin family protein [Cyclobacteriaceae bacterium]
MLSRTSKFFPEMPSLFSGFFDDDRWNNFGLGERLMSNVPAANVIEHDDEFLIELAAPGMEKKDFHVNIENGQLLISSEKEETKKEEEENYTRREFSYRSFNRTFQLPDTVNADKIKATYKDGVLQLMLPKKPEAVKTPKKEIAIN